jgi:hypothetical protein
MRSTATSTLQLPIECVSRVPRGMAMLIDPLKLNQPLAAFNGGVLMQPD